MSNPNPKTRRDIKVKCPKCGYEWEYKGKLISVTCPNCQHKFKVRKSDSSGN